MDENARKFVRISLWVTAIFLLGRFLISWADVRNLLKEGQIFIFSYNCFGFIGEAIGAATIVMAIFNKWAWKWKCLHWIHDVPVLAKTYSGAFISDYDNVKRAGMIVINQTFLTVSVRLKTDESNSRSLTASFSQVQDVEYLIYNYQNDPWAEIQDRSPMHYGTAMLDVSNPMLLEGNYFTGRKSRGSMKFKAKEDIR